MYPPLLTAEKKIRDLALFNTALDTMLRASDLLPLRVIDITDHNGDVVHEFTIKQKKTGRGHLVALSPNTRDSIADWMIASGKGPEDFLWTSIGNRKTGRPLTREQYANLVKRWSSLARLDPKRHDTHSMRRSKSAAIYDATQNLAACQHLLGHKSIGSTAHYLESISARRLIWPRELKSEGGNHDEMRTGSKLGFENSSFFAISGLWLPWVSDR